MLALAKKEYQFYMKVWSMLQAMVGDDIFSRVDELSITESEAGVFNTRLKVYKPRREYAESYNATINPQSLEFTKENISECDCGFTARDINRYIQSVFDSLSKVPYGVKSIRFQNKMGSSYKQLHDDGEYSVVVCTYPKEELEKCLSLPYSVENYGRLIGSIDSRDKHQPFGRGDRCPINKVINGALRLVRGKGISISECKKGDILMLIDGCSLGINSRCNVSPYYTAGETIVEVGSKVEDSSKIADGYHCEPFVEIEVSSSTFYGISGGAYNSNGKVFHGKTNREVFYVADKIDGKPSYLSNKDYVRLEDFYKVLKEVLVDMKDEYGLFI